MKKLFFIAALASLTLVSCVKDEPAASVDAQHEISFMAAPITKATGPFQTTNVFESWAFYTPTDWATNKATAVVYGNLGDVLIEYDDDDTSANYQDWWNVTGGEHFYWPKAGKLTFFSYSLNSHLTDDDVKCNTEKGIYVEDYNVNTKKDVDFLVADMAEDLNSGEVPTLFRHKLSNVAFTIETTANYTATKTFKLKSITLNKLAAEADYRQLGTEGWSGYGTDVAATTFYNTPDLTFDHTGVTPDPVQYLYMPQEWDGDETVTIVYTVTSGGATENVSITKDLDEIFTDGWEMGKKYTCAIKIGLQEILWTPSVEEWAPGTAADFEIN